MPRMVVNGIDVYYETSGHGEPLVFIHGLGSSTRDWAPQVAEFCTKYNVITEDLRGHGQSDKPPGPYSIPMFASDTAGLLGELGTTPAHVVGISLGGAVALQLALDAPALVRSLTVVNSGPSLGGTPEQQKAEIDRRVNIVQQMGMRAMGQALAPNLFPKPEHESLRRDFIENWASNDPQAYIEATRSMLGWDVTSQIPGIRCPALILTADQDYTPVAAKEAYARTMPNARVKVIPNTHHAIPMEAPEAFNVALMQFLAENE